MADEVDHGPETVVYASDGVAYKPLIVCMCGWSSGVGCCDNWEEAGADFDEHLAESHGTIEAASHGR